MSYVPTLAQHLNALGPKRILALDGGGVRGIISIAFLEQIEAQLQERSGRGENFRLSDYFDLVGGTSVGSILATLVALGYRVSEIRTLFESWCPEIFKRPMFGVPGLTPRFSSWRLKSRSRELLGDMTLESPKLKTGLAIICKRVDTGSPWVLTNNPGSKYWDDPTDRTYHGNRNYRVADLIRASAAAPYYFAPKRIRIGDDQVGLFVDGGVSPFNNPALMLFMLAGIRGYGFQWRLGADNVLMASVGTGSYRLRYKPALVQRNISGLFAANALAGLIGDAEMLSLTLLQWLSDPKRRWEINSEVGQMDGELLGHGDTEGGAKPLLSFVRFDARLEERWLSEHCPAALSNAPYTADILAGLQQLDRPDLMSDMYKVGLAAARRQVTPDDFPASFDPVAP